MPRYDQPADREEQEKMIAATTFTCTICGRSSQDICVYCTKDTCANHMCERCHRCSDCCVCDSPVIRGMEAEEETPHEVAENEMNENIGIHSDQS